MFANQFPSFKSQYKAIIREEIACNYDKNSYLVKSRYGGTHVEREGFSTVVGITFTLVIHLHLSSRQESRYPSNVG